MAISLNEILRAVLGRRITLGVRSTTTSEARVGAMVHGVQERSWRLAGLLDRTKDPTFPFSGLFTPPAAIEEMIARSLMLSGLAVNRPIVTAQPITDEFQEKLSLPFVYAAWGRLEATGNLPSNLTLGANAFLASAPTGKIYPATIPETISGTYAFVFDASLLLFYRIFLTSMARVCLLQKVGAEGNDASGIKWGRDYTLDRTLDDILAYDLETTNIASLLLNISVRAIPFSENFSQLILNARDEMLIATLVDDLYTYLLAHEVGHVTLGHFKAEGQRAEPTTLGHNIGIEEREADVYAFAVIANTISLSDGNFRVYINTSIIFCVMGFIYRAVHLLYFRRDYGHLSPQVQYRIHFPPNHYYPYPSTRLFWLRREIRARASTLPTEIGKWDEQVDAFFENLWKPVCLKLMSARVQVAPLWNDIVHVHQQAYEVED
jgi:hypothetical protein